jgi:FXSXX-COOH protein
VSSISDTVVDTLERIADTPLAEIPAADARAIIRRIVEAGKDDKGVPVAAFGSSI